MIVVASAPTTTSQQEHEPLNSADSHGKHYYVDAKHSQDDDASHAKKKKKHAPVQAGNDITSPGTIGWAYYVAQSGFGLSCILFIVYAIITAYTLCLLFNMATATKTKNLPDLCKHAFGIPGYLLASFFIFVFNFGGYIAQFQMLGEAVPDLLIFFFGPHPAFNRVYVIIFFGLAFLPIAFAKNLASISFLSAATIFSVYIITAMTLICCIMRFGISPTFKVPADAYYFARKEVLAALGGMSYTFVCHDLSFNVFQELKNPTRTRYYTVVGVCMVLTVFTVASIGLGGFFLFYDNNLIVANVIENFPKGSMPGVFGRLLLAFAVAASLPYSCFMPRQGLMFILSTCVPHIRKHRLCSNVFHYTATMLLVSLSVLIACLVADLGATFEIIGGVSACSIAYIMPPLLSIRLSSKWLSLNNLASFIVLLLGIFIFFASLFSVVYRIVTTGS